MAGFPPAIALAASAVSPVKRQESSSAGVTRSRYPGGRVLSRSAPGESAADRSTLRNSDMRTWRLARALSAGCSGHSSSSSCPAATTWLACTISVASTARARAPLSSSDRPPTVTSTGPRMLNSMVSTP